MWKFKFLMLLMFASIACQASVIDVDNYQALASDKRAFRIGDPLVVLVLENTRAESTALTGVRKKLGIGASAFDTIVNKGVGLDISARGEGSGQTVRQGRATTQLSVRITEILPNSLFKVSGEQSLIINGENQKVSLSGVVREDDISKSNTVMSNRIADAKIEIVGVGTVSEAQRQNILYRVFKWLRIL